MDNGTGSSDWKKCRIWPIKMINMYPLIFTRASVDLAMYYASRACCISLGCLLDDLLKRITGVMCKYSNSIHRFPPGPTFLMSLIAFLAILSGGECLSPYNYPDSAHYGLREGWCLCMLGKGLSLIMLLP